MADQWSPDSPSSLGGWESIAGGSLGRVDIEMSAPSSVSVDEIRRVMRSAQRDRVRLQRRLSEVYSLIRRTDAAAEEPAGLRPTPASPPSVPPLSSVTSTQNQLAGTRRGLTENAQYLEQLLARMMESESRARCLLTSPWQGQCTHRPHHQPHHHHNHQRQGRDHHLDVESGSASLTGDCPGSTTISGDCDYVWPAHEHGGAPAQAQQQRDDRVEEHEEEEESSAGSVFERVTAADNNSSGWDPWTGAAAAGGAHSSWTQPLQLAVRSAVGEQQQRPSHVSQINQRESTEGPPADTTAELAEMRRELELLRRKLRAVRRCSGGGSAPTFASHSLISTDQELRRHCPPDATCSASVTDMPDLSTFMTRRRSAVAGMNAACRPATRQRRASAATSVTPSCLQPAGVGEQLRELTVAVRQLSAQMHCENSVDDRVEAASFLPQQRQNSPLQSRSMHVCGACESQCCRAVSQQQQTLVSLTSQSVELLRSHERLLTDIVRRLDERLPLAAPSSLSCRQRETDAAAVTRPSVEVVAGPALNNQVTPGLRANNYWDNLRSYSRQNQLSPAAAAAAAAVVVAAAAETNGIALDPASTASAPATPAAMSAAAAVSTDVTHEDRRSTELSMLGARPRVKKQKVNCENQRLQRTVTSSTLSPATGPTSGGAACGRDAGTHSLRSQTTSGACIERMLQQLQLSSVDSPHDRRALLTATAAAVQSALNAEQPAGKKRSNSEACVFSSAGVGETARSGQLAGMDVAAMAVRNNLTYYDSGSTTAAATVSCCSLNNGSTSTTTGHDGAPRRHHHHHHHQRRHQHIDQLSPSHQAQADCHFTVLREGGAVSLQPRASTARLTAHRHTEDDATDDVIDLPLNDDVTSDGVGDVVLDSSSAVAAETDEEQVDAYDDALTSDCCDDVEGRPAAVEHDLTSQHLTLSSCTTTTISTSTPDHAEREDNVEVPSTDPASPR